jgi:hypothetical protein
MTNDERMTKSETPRDEFDNAFWNDATAPIVCEEPDTTRVYDLEERTARFGETVIDFAKSIPRSAVTTVSLTNSSAREPASERITSKLTTRFQKRNS